MTLPETIKLLAVAAAFDRRHIGEADSVAWHAALAGLEYPDAEAAVIAHYRESREWIMPADVWGRVRAMRRDRLAAVVIPAPEADPDLPGSYRAALTAVIRRIGDGLSVRRAIGGPVREGPPPEAFTAAREALPKPPTKQERAAAQAAESRAEREAAARKEAAGAGAE